jgi:hypothetical protein
MIYIIHSNNVGMTSYFSEKIISRNEQHMLDTKPNSKLYTIGLILGINLRQIPDKLFKNVPTSTKTLTNCL